MGAVMLGRWLPCIVGTACLSPHPRREGWPSFGSLGGYDSKRRVTGESSEGEAHARKGSKILPYVWKLGMLPIAEDSFELSVSRIGLSWKGMAFGDLEFGTCV